MVQWLILNTSTAGGSRSSLHGELRSPKLLGTAKIFLSFFFFLKEVVEIQRMLSPPTGLYPYDVAAVIFLAK